MALSAAQCLTLTDKLTALWIAALGTDGSGYGLGTVGASARAYKKATDEQALVIALNDATLIAQLMGSANALVTAVDAYNAIGQAANQHLRDIDSACKAAGLAGVIGLDTFANYYNITAGPWLCLFAPDFRELYKGWANGQAPTATNVYFEVLQSVYTNGMRKLVVGGSQTAGQDIDYTKYAGGFGQIIWSGMSGSGTVTVTGTWRKTDGSVATGDGTYAVSGASGTGVLTPPFTNALLLTVTNIAAGGTLASGTIYAEGKRPTGRTNPPT